MTHDIRQLFDSDGPLSLHLKGYETRKEQQEMAQAVWEAFKDERVALVEAGTGTGKSLAYLIPAIKWAIDHDEKVLLSTNTIALQEQLIEKDIPLALKILGVSIPYMRCLGTSNYLCLRRLEEEVEERSLFAPDNEEELAEIDAFSRYTRTGIKSELPILPKAETWAKVAVDTHACTHSDCPHFSRCFLFKAKREAQEAKLLVVNHHLLLSDLARRVETNNFSQTAVLPNYSRLILDEAHHIEDVACEHFALKASRLTLLKLLSDLTLVITHKKASEAQEELSTLRRTAETQAALLFEGIYTTLLVKEPKLRILQITREQPFWATQVTQRAFGLTSSCHSLIIALQKLEDRLKSDKEAEGLQLLLGAIKSKLTSFTANLQSFFENVDNKEKVYWIRSEPKKELPEVELVSAPHTVANVLNNKLFETCATTVLCSATLSTHSGFGYIKRRLGISDIEIERIYPSPFAYKDQVLMAIPSDLPPPESAQFTEASHTAILSCIEASRGNAFVLFTSYEAMQRASRALFDELVDKKFYPLKQGDDHRHALIRRFKETPRSVLFATDSFWEGVDIVGDALRLVIITKLPFHVPSDPLSEARCEQIKENGGNPFFDYSLPKAAVKLKQAFGRLIRHKNDRGACVLLDTRLLTKGYGKMLLKSLPDCMESFEPLDVVKSKMVQFYRTK